MIKRWWRAFYYAFPIQLMVLHLRANLGLTLLWLLLMSTVSGGFGRSLGFHYLFLDPEYLGKVSFWSFYLIGLSFATFFIAWNTTTYILNSYRFPFLASLNRPFAKYTFNNAILPLIFVVFYLRHLIYFQWYNEFAAEHSIIFYCLGFLSGFASMLVLMVIYFQFTNKDIVTFQNRPKIKLADAIHSLVLKRREYERQMKLGEDPYKDAIRVDRFLTETLHWRLVRSVRHYNHKMLERVFRQNHFNALFIQSLSITALLLMGAMVEYRYFRIPAASSILLLFSIISTVLGALIYWLQEWRILFLILVIGLSGEVMKWEMFAYPNRAYGLDYEKPKQAYTYEVLDSLSQDKYYREDYQATYRILRNWRNKFYRRLAYRKPRLLVVCSSGGGARAALWSMQVMREIDRRLEGRLMEHTLLMTGASGGMLGAAYYRELYYRKQKGEKIDLYNFRYVENICKDLANALTFTFLVNDIFIPWVDRKIQGFKYKQDRGYVFEQQFIENLQGLLDVPLSYYQEPEAKGQIPLMFVTPIIINDGRFMVISPQRVSYMMRPPFIGEGDMRYAEIDGVDFQAMFAEHQAPNLRFTTALRMSATYPLIFPSVHMPTQPAIELMDAGFRDNHGIESATRFLSIFRDWISQNTSGVTILAIRASEKIGPIPKSRTRNLFSAIFTPLNSMLEVDLLQDYHHDNYISYLRSRLGQDKVDLLYFTYRPTQLEELASLSLHLTQREKNDILNAIYYEDNQKNINRLKEMLR